MRQIHFNSTKSIFRQKLISFTKCTLSMGIHSHNPIPLTDSWNEVHSENEINVRLIKGGFLKHYQTCTLRPWNRDPSPMDCCIIRTGALLIRLYTLSLESCVMVGQTPWPWFWCTRYTMCMYLLSAPTKACGSFLYTCPYSPWEWVIHAKFNTIV